MAKLLAWSLWWIGRKLYRAGDRILVVSERVQGDGPGPWFFTRSGRDAIAHVRRVQVEDREDGEWGEVSNIRFTDCRLGDGGGGCISPTGEALDG